MLTITEAYVDSLALNASAAKNGRDLVKKNSFTLLCRAEDDTLLFGDCKGSGKEPYRCSVDLIQPDNPVFRCSCPSRQFPCKHLLGLMYAHALGKPFAQGELPQDIADKREKAEKREEKKKAEEESGQAPVKRKTNFAALAKKINAQLEGLELADKLLQAIAQSGLGGIDAKAARMFREQAQQLGNAYIPGIQTSFRRLLTELEPAEGEREMSYTRAVARMAELHTLLKKSREHLSKRAEDPAAVPMETGTALEEGIGHAWQLAELREYGLTEADAELLQLSLRSYDDPAREEFVNEGHWVHLGNGLIFATRTYRPYRASKHIREEDSEYRVVRAKELSVYPGDLNARVRWEEAQMREPSSEDLARVVSLALTSFPEAVKRVKNQLKDPMADKNPLLLVAYREVAVNDGQTVLVDAQDKQLILADLPRLNYATTPLLPLLERDQLQDGAMLVMFGHDLVRNRLEAQPLAVVSGRGIVRLLI